MHVGACLHGHQHNVSMLISINLGEEFLPTSCIRKIAYLPCFFSHILDFIYYMVLIFILISFEWRDAENQQLKLLIVFSV